MYVKVGLQSSACCCTRANGVSFQTREAATPPDHLFHSDDTSRPHEVHSVVHVAHAGGVRDFVLGHLQNKKGTQGTSGIPDTKGNMADGVSLAYKTHG